MVKLWSPGVSVRKAQYSSLFANTECKKALKAALIHPFRGTNRKKSKKYWILSSRLHILTRYNADKMKSQPEEQGTRVLLKKLTPWKNIQRIRQSPPNSVTFRKDLLLGEKLLATCPTCNAGNHPSTGIRHCSFSKLFEANFLMK